MNSEAKVIDSHERNRLNKKVMRGMEKGYPEQAMVDDLLDEGLNREQAEEIVFSVYGHMKTFESNYANNMIAIGIVLTIVGVFILYLIFQANPTRIFKIMLLPFVAGIISLVGGLILKLK
jgi:hypothetical protein